MPDDAPQRMTGDEYRRLVEAGIIAIPTEMLDGRVHAGQWRLAFSPAQRAAAGRLGIELPPDETVDEHETYLGRTDTAQPEPTRAATADAADHSPSAAFAEFASAARRAAEEVVERPRDRSFLEATLEGAIARHLPGTARTDQQRRRFVVPGFEPAPHGVDIDWSLDHTHVGIEVKVTDVLDSLFDVIKLVTAVAHGRLDEGFCAVAATERQWRGGGAFEAMTSAAPSRWHEWSVQDVLAAPAARGAVLVASGPRPFEVPSQFEAMAAAEISMPLAPTHVLRLLAVRPIAGAPLLRLPER